MHSGRARRCPKGAGDAAYHVPEDLADLRVGERDGLHVVGVEERADGVLGAKPVDLVRVRVRVRVRSHGRRGASRADGALRMAQARAGEASPLQRLHRTGGGAA